MAGNVEELDRLTRLIADMLFLARADQGDVVSTRSQVDLAVEAARVAEFLSVVADERGVRVEVTGSARVQGDQILVQRAITNLLTNAIRHAEGVVSENGQQSTVSKPALPLSCSHIATTIEPLKPSREMTMSTADTYVRARIDTSTKERAADALEAMGLSISDAIRLLMLRIADERRMPFDVKAPNATTRKAIAELEAGKGKRFASVDDLMADLHADD